jgi:putative Flp pilus-assembly TadE/G-like protein
MSENLAHKRPAERGVTILLVAIAMVTLLGMAALAIDVVSLYVARNEAQRAADTAALAAARTLAGSGVTSDPGDSTGMRSAAQSLALQAAQAAAGQHTIAGQTVAPADVNMPPPSFSNGSNPQVTITVQRTNLPTFFARIWGSRLSSVRATAKAEAFNPSGSSIPISIASVKPMLIANCWNSGGSPQNLLGCGNSGTSQYILDPNSNYSVVNSNIIGKPLVLHEQDPTKQALPGWYYPLQVGNGPNDIPAATNCPSTMDVSCSAVGGNNFGDAIACAGSVPLSCGKVVTERLNASVNTQACAALRCLIHADPNSFLITGQDVVNVAGSTVTIDGGASNPNPGLRNVSQISRSDSIITLPIADDPCPGGGGGPGGGLNFAYLFFDHGGNGGEDDEVCGNGNSVNVPIVGFLQVAVRQIRLNGDIDVVVLNAIGCAGTSGTPISGGGLSPVPVRLIQ